MLEDTRRPDDFDREFHKEEPSPHTKLRNFLQAGEHFHGEDGNGTLYRTLPCVAINDSSFKELGDLLITTDYMKCEYDEDDREHLILIPDDIEIQISIPQGPFFLVRNNDFMVHEYNENSLGSTLESGILRQPDPQEAHILTQIIESISIIPNLNPQN